jgi:hypothetical protein
MSSRELQRWNEEKPCEEALGSEGSRIGDQIEPGLGLRHPTAWESSSHCDRCRGLMYRIELRDWGGSKGQDGCAALQCMACGDIIDPVIVKNRRCSGQPPMVRRKTREGRRCDGPLTGRFVPVVGGARL